MLMFSLYNVVCVIITHTQWVKYLQKVEMPATGQSTIVWTELIVSYWLLLRVNFSPFLLSVPYTARSLWVHESCHCVFVLCYCSRWRQAHDEGSKVDQQRDADRIPVKLHIQGPTSESCSEEVTICMLNTSLLSSSVFICVHLMFIINSIWLNEWIVLWIDLWTTEAPLEWLWYDIIWTGMILSQFCLFLLSHTFYHLGVKSGQMVFQHELYYS